MDCNIVEKANRIVNSEEDCYLALISENGYPSVSTISSIKTDGIFKAYFSSSTNGPKSLRIAKNNKASVCYRSEGNNVTLVGTIKVLTDTKTKNSLWVDWFIKHFPEGKDDPNYCIFEFTTKTVNLWIDRESAVFKISDVLKVQSRCGLLCNTCKYKESVNCVGCIETMGNPFHGECPIAICCQKLGYSHCGECPEMPCEQLNNYSCGDEEHGDKPAGARLSILKHWKEKSSN
ncbi:MAG: pyridoxamine 5'-phosphate oxidase family protein [Clostridiales bacterium]|nr:pyridoxamine 5'-phosphate oxidase family protein [Clostridiales bacterium]